MHARFTVAAVSFCLVFAVANRPFAGNPAATAPADAKPPGEAKAAAPDADALASATKVVKEIYGTEWAAAKSPAQKQTLARKLLQKGRETVDDKPGQFVLFRLARDMAVQIPDAAIAFEAIAGLDQAFVVEILEMKADALTKIAPLATTQADHKALALKAFDVVNEAVQKGNYAIAKQIMELAFASARKSNDAALAKLSVDRKANLEELSKAFEEAKAALDVLEKTPLDPAANLTVGKYCCFVEGKWEKGLPMLVLGGDAALQSVAEIELRGAATPSEQAKLGDGWWDLAEAQTGNSKKPVQARAAYWYRQALPKLSGLGKDKVEKRLASLTASPQWADLLADLDVQKNTVSGKWAKSKDGIVGGGSSGYAFSTLVLSGPIKGDYDLEIEFTRLSGTECFGVFLPVASSNVILVIAGRNNKVHALGDVDGKIIDNPGNPTKIVAPLLANDKKHKLFVSVKTKEQSSIDASLDGQKLIKWSGKASSLAANPDWKWENASQVGAGSFTSPIRLDSVKMRSTSADAESKPQQNIPKQD